MTADPRGFDVVLALSGGNALGAFEAGVYEALHDGGLQPNWVVGVSIGAINAALITGFAPERRVDRLRAFWRPTTHRSRALRCRSSKPGDAPTR